MSRTKRAKLPKGKWLRNFSFKNQLSQSLKAVEELEEEGFNVRNRLHQKSNPGSVATNYDDLTISALGEQWEN